MYLRFTGEKWIVLYVVNIDMVIFTLVMEWAH